MVVAAVERTRCLAALAAALEATLLQVVVVLAELVV